MNMKGTYCPTIHSILILNFIRHYSTRAELVIFHPAVQLFLLLFIPDLNSFFFPVAYIKMIHFGYLQSIVIVEKALR